MFNKYHPFITLIAFLLFEVSSGVTIGIEEFQYNTGPLNGQDGGTGFSGAWTSGSDFSITTPGLTHLAQTSDTDVSGNNRVTLTGSTSTAARSLSLSGIILVANALTSTQGLWYRALFLNQNQGTPPVSDMSFQLQLGNSDATVDVAVVTDFNQSLSQGALYIGANSQTINLPGTSSAYLAIVNLKITDQNTSTFAGDLWVLDPTQNFFDPSSSPNASVSQVLNTYVPDSVSIELSSFMSGLSNIDQIYFGERPEDLGLNVVPEPATIVSILTGVCCWFKWRGKKQSYLGGCLSKIHIAEGE